MGADIFDLIYKISIPTNLVYKNKEITYGESFHIFFKHCMKTSITDPNNKLKVKKSKIFFISRILFLYATILYKINKAQLTYSGTWIPYFGKM